MSDWPKRPEICRGCWVSVPNERATVCTMQPVWNKKQCPCTTCLVKVVCEMEEGQCEIYDKFAMIQ